MMPTVRPSSSPCRVPPPCRLASHEPARKLATEHSQLQLEQGTWATHARVEQVATKRLGMRPPDAASTVVLKLEEPAR